MDIVDASNLERNLYLTIQLLELGCGLIILLNKREVAERNRIEINSKELEKLLVVPVVESIAPKKIGMKELLDKIIEMVS